LLRALWFAFKLGLLVALAVWVANRPGYIDISWLGYDIRVQLWFILLSLLVFILLLLIVHRIYFSFISFRKYLRQKHEKKKQAKGYQALTLGLSAVAAGDSKIASYQASRMRKLLPDDKGLSLLLEAQSARLAGDQERAIEYFEQLVKNKDTAFLGLRGLMVLAAEKGDASLALSYAENISKIYSDQPWVIQSIYDLELRTGNWDKALRTLDRAKKHKVLLEEKYLSDKVAIYIQKADVALAKNEIAAAGKFFLRAFQLSNDHVPAAICFANFNLNKNKRKKAENIIRKCWQLTAHPELVDLWKKVIPNKYNKDSLSRLKWYENLTKLNPNGYEGYLAVAKAAIEEGLWGEAERNLVNAEANKKTYKLYYLWSEMEKARGKLDAAQAMLEKASKAEPEKVWTCNKTGIVYSKWSPIAEPHGGFNTIIWGFPNINTTEVDEGLIEVRDFLISS
jgi:HemY protein